MHVRVPACHATPGTSTVSADRRTTGEWSHVRYRTTWSPEAFTSQVYQEEMSGKPRLSGARAAPQVFEVPHVDALPAGAGRNASGMQLRGRRAGRGRLRRQVLGLAQLGDREFWNPTRPSR